MKVASDICSADHIIMLAHFFLISSGKIIIYFKSIRALNIKQSVLTNI